jgi:predicted Fe-S protein YdhL (DUF1289 family)
MTEPVISPCTGVCRLNPRTRLCEGCRRTMEEIAGWLDYTPERKRAIIAALAARDAFKDPDEGGAP